MRHPLSISVCVIVAALVQSGAGEPLIPSEWRHFSPILKSQIRTLREGEADSILARSCQTPVHPVQVVDLTCTDRRRLRFRLFRYC